MRIALITLAVAALTFIGSIIWIVANKNGINFWSFGTTSTVKISDETASVEILRSQWKMEDRIKTMEAKIDALSGKPPTTETESNSSDTASSANSQKNTTTDATGAVIIPISAKFLTKIITKVNLNLTKNNGIFGLYTFDRSTEYSTYADAKSGIVIIASRTPYVTWLKNFQAIDKTLYTTNEVKTFPFPTFYLNTLRPDSTVRLVMQVEAQTLLVSIPKSKFTEFKTLMTKK